MALRRESAAPVVSPAKYGVVQVEPKLKEKIQVHGLGYIGFPTSLMFALSGHEVVGVDLNASTVDLLNRGSVHLIEEGLEDCFAEVRSSGRFRATTAPESADVFIIAVPTPAAGMSGADLSYVEAATRSVAAVLRRGNLVVLESTVPPATCTGVVGPLIERLVGLKHGIDYDLVHCPERVIPGRILKELVENERIVGGTSPQAAERAAELYRGFVTGNVHCTDATTAELVKVMENTFRDVNIALANEFRDICRHVGADAYEAISLANRHPRVNVHQPGIGVGGHCIPVDPWFLVAAAPEHTRIIRSARDVNAAIPGRIAEYVANEAVRNADAILAFYGMAYKPNVDDFRESPAVEVIVEVARRFEGPCLVVDPFAESLPVELARIPNVRLATLDEAVLQADLHVGLVAHSRFAEDQTRPNPARLLDFGRVWTNCDPLAKA